MKTSFAVRVLSVFPALIIERNGLGFSTTEGKINELRFYGHARKQETRNINTCNTTLRANSAQNTRTNNFSFTLQHERSERSERRVSRSYGCGGVIQNPPLNCPDDIIVMYSNIRQFRHTITGQLTTSTEPRNGTCIFTCTWHAFVQGIPILCLASFTSHPILQLGLTRSTLSVFIFCSVVLKTLRKDTKKRVVNM